MLSNEDGTENGWGTMFPVAVFVGRSTRMRPCPPFPPLEHMIGWVVGLIPPPWPPVAVILPLFSNLYARRWMLPPLPPPPPLPHDVPKQQRY